MKNKVSRALLLMGLFALLATLGSGQAQAIEPGMGQMADVRKYETHEGWEEGAFQTIHTGHQSGKAQPFEISGSSTLTRTSGGVVASLQASEMEAGAWTMWWIFYNHPESCLHPMFDPEG